MKTTLPPNQSTSECTDEDTRLSPNGISPEDFLEEVEAVKSSFDPLPHKEVLDQLLQKIDRVDFRKKTGIEDEDRKLKQKHYLVCAIEELIGIANTNHWGLAKQHDFIYLYNGAYWSLLEVDEIKNFLGRAAERMSIDRYDARHYQYREQLFKQFLSAAYLRRLELPQDRVLINLHNGTFEFSPEGDTLRDFDRQDFLTYQLPFEYDPAAKAPLFQAYLNRVQPDQQRQNILAEFLGYVFARHLKLEKTLLLYGNGANGKSVFFEIVSALLGRENITNFSLQSLTDVNGYYRAKLGNALVNYASEINGKLEASIFKQLISGEPVEARLPYGQPFILNLYARFIFNCNELPRDVEHTDAFFRRFLIVPFDVTIPDEEQDKGLANKIIKSELSGVFNWVLTGLNRLIAQGDFTKSEAVNQQLAQYRKESDSVQLFLDEEEYEIGTNAYILMKTLYPEYKLFCLSDNYRPVSKTNFRKRLEALKVEVKRIGAGNVAYLSKSGNF